MDALTEQLKIVNEEIKDLTKQEGPAWDALERADDPKMKDRWFFKWDQLQARIKDLMEERIALAAHIAGQGEKVPTRSYSELTSRLLVFNCTASMPLPLHSIKLRNMSTIR